MLNTLVSALETLGPLVGKPDVMPLIYNIATLSHAIATFAMFLIRVVYNFMCTHVVCNEPNGSTKQKKALGLTILVLCGTMYCLHLTLLESNVGPVYELSLNMTSYLVVYMCKTVNAAVFQKKHRTAVSSFTLTVALVVTVTFFLLKEMRSFTFVKNMDMELQHLRTYNFDRTVLPDADKSKYFTFTNDTVGKECSRKQEIEYIVEPDSILSSVVSIFFNTSTVVETEEEICTTIPIERADSQHVVSTVEEFSLMEFLGWFISMPWQIKGEDTKVQYQLLFHAMCNATYIVLALPITTCVNVLAYIGTILWKPKEEVDKSGDKNAQALRERTDWLLAIIASDDDNSAADGIANEFLTAWANELNGRNRYTHSVYFHFLFKRGHMHAYYYAHVNTQSTAYGCIRDMEMSWYETIINHTYGIIYLKVVHGTVYAENTTTEEQPIEYFNMGFTGLEPWQKKALAMCLERILKTLTHETKWYMDNAYNAVSEINQV
jgi:hypothetical protein